MDKITIKINGILYAGEHRSDYLFVENFTPKDGKEYAMRVRATDGNVYIAEFKDGRTLIEQCFIPRPGHLSAELCEKVSGEYVALSAVFMSAVFESIDETGDTPPPYEQAKSLAERAIEAADRAEEIADSINTGSGAVTDEQIQNAVNDYLKENPIEIDIPDSLPNPNALTFTGAVETVYDGSKAVTVEIPIDGSSPTEKEWRLINSITLEEDVSDILIEKDSEGNAFECDELYLKFSLKRTSTTWNNLRFAFTDPTVYEMVVTSQPINLNTIPFKIYVYKLKSEVFVEFTANQSSNTPANVMRTGGVAVEDGQRFIVVKINRANGDLYIGAGSTLEIYGR